MVNTGLTVVVVVEDVVSVNLLEALTLTEDIVDGVTTGLDEVAAATDEFEFDIKLMSLTLEVVFITGAESADSSTTPLRGWILLVLLATVPPSVNNIVAAEFSDPLLRLVALVSPIRLLCSVELDADTIKTITKYNKNRKRLELGSISSNYKSTITFRFIFSLFDV